ncbi:ABC transporter ATP-binding protein/permease [Chloroflexi bacterium TSY]|nr:ABC transporter ATP-binding protein/permease [Chloroflexi bacterium TSY]
MRTEPIALSFWRLLCFQPWSYLLVLGTKLCFFTLLPQATGLLTRQFFDQLTDQAVVGWNMQTLLWLLIGIGLARAVTVVIDIVGNRLFRHPLGVLLRKNVLDYLLAQPAAQALSISTGEAISRLRDDPSAVANFLYMTTFLVANLLFALIALVVMVSINGWVTALVFGPLVLVIVVANQMRKRIEKLTRASREGTDQITEFIGEVFGAVQAVQVATAESNVIVRFRLLNEQRRTAMLQQHLLNGLLEAFFRNVPILGAGVIMLVAAGAMIEGSFTVGDFVLFVFYLGSLNDVVYIVGMTLTEYREAAVAFQRLIETTQELPGAALVHHGPIYQRGAAPVLTHPRKSVHDRLETLSIDNLTYVFPSSGRGIQNLSLQLNRGSVTIITGEVGAGKTTFLKVLLGLLPRDMGEIRWNGTLIADPSRFFVPPRSAYVAQTPRLFSDSVLDNILLGLPHSETVLDQAIHTTVLEPDIAQLEAGLATRVGPRGVKLSGGQQQRVAAARLLVREPEFLIIDDLSSALDVETEILLWEHLLANKAERTILAVSHRPVALRHADQVIVLEEGKQLEGSHYPE